MRTVDWLLPEVAALVRSGNDHSPYHDCYPSVQCSATAALQFAVWMNFKEPMRAEFQSHLRARVYRSTTIAPKDKRSRSISRLICFPPPLAWWFLDPALGLDQCSFQQVISVIERYMASGEETAV